MALYGPHTVTIANNQALSSALQLVPQNKEGLINLYVSADGWTAADLAIQVSFDGTTYFPLLKEDASFYVADGFVADQLWRIPNVPPFRFIKLWSKNTASTANVNQGALRTLTVAVEVELS